jgi:hypothetical protein
VVKQAAFAEAGAAIIATELIAVSNVIPAFATFYGSVDELKHQRFVIQSRGVQKRKERAIRPFISCGLARFHCIQQ